VARAYGVVLAVTIAACAGLAATFDFGDRYPDRWAVALGVALVFLGLLFLCSIGPLRPWFERAGLGPRRDQSTAGRALSLIGSFFGVFDAWVMRAVLGRNAGFLAMFAWLAVSFTVALALYALVRQRLAPTRW
jgi:hypothetical protein